MYIVYALKQREIYTKMLTTKTSKILLGGVNGQRNPGGGGPTRVTVTRRRRTKDTDANTTHTTNKKKRMRVPRAFAREYPTYDELPGNDARGGRKPETQSNGRWQPTGNEEEDFFFKNTPREPQQHTRGRRNDGNPDFYAAAVSRFPLLLLLLYLLRFPPPLAIGSSYASWRSRRRCRSRRYARASPRRA